VDNLTQADKFRNLADCEIADYLDKDEFLDLVENGELDGDVEAIFHQGACSDTMETDGRYMMANNYRYSLALLDFCARAGVPFLYASSASVYGGGGVFREEREFESPLNVYGYSKFLFDQIVRRRLPGARLAGRRASAISTSMARANSTRGAWPRWHSTISTSTAPLAEVSSCSRAMRRLRQRRAEAATSFTSATSSRSTWTFSKVGKVRHLQSRHRPRAELQRTRRRDRQCLPCAGRQAGAGAWANWSAQGIIEYIPFPEALKGKYQSFTEADLTAIARCRLPEPNFATVEEGVGEYVGMAGAMRRTP
jgi:ADP-L-glycero-D-manno-heptose 6-epimerase